MQSAIIAARDCGQIFGGKKTPDGFDALRANTCEVQEIRGYEREYDCLDAQKCEVGWNKIEAKRLIYGNAILS